MNWKKYFDHIYCVHHVSQSGRLNGLMDELCRVGIADSGVFSFVITSDEPWERLIAEKCPIVAEDAFAQKCYVNLGLALARTFREALSWGYRRILIIEDDVRFLNDLREIEAMLDGMPDWEIVQLDKLVPKWDMTADEYQRMADERRIEGHEGYFDGGPDIFTSGACFAVSSRGMEALLKGEEKYGPRPMDILFQAVGVRRAIIDGNIAVQVAFKDAVNVRNLKAGNTHHKGYVMQGLRYEDYAVPEGYGYGVESASY